MNTPSPGPARLLVVDDDKMVREHYYRLLTRAGYQVRTAASGREALSIIAEDPPDLVLLDLAMPDMGGLAVLREMRHLRRRPVTVLLSGCATREQAGAAVVLGAAGVIDKAQLPPALRARLKHFLNAIRDPMLCWIREHHAEIHGRNDVVRYFRVSPRTVSSHVLRAAGQPFHDFLQDCRVREAQRLLLTSEMEVKEIAKRVGFGSVRTMDRVFLQLTGCGPTQFRQHARDEGSVCHIMPAPRST